MRLSCRALPGGPAWLPQPCPYPPPCPAADHLASELTRGRSDRVKTGETQLLCTSKTASIYLMRLEEVGLRQPGEPRPAGLTAVQLGDSGVSPLISIAACAATGRPARQLVFFEAGGHVPGAACVAATDPVTGELGMYHGDVLYDDPGFTERSLAAVQLLRSTLQAGVQPRFVQLTVDDTRAGPSSSRTQLPRPAAFAQTEQAMTDFLA